ncbi:LacI family DNA-binding transcriptional regulator [Lacrimispora saccharolytica]|uniref:Transcriptional regulator, LacI family n=1 Tax=Lacrimispora saccharolytica (strain ATCC 35040 / DSM 2544 / NRCC 2533 / WM1) TaxID=610130 RepID=D9R026_LACSW|nr:LacI family DNA-binding transcriptional regulator [Lacrimispora saccharolytica]ADL04477.1 transcriptional regulator, LacI family [[Clostridium] saccharolyticum WM1]QRV21263.1 LacI family DNA-binding transcriptional regulator [Lacrimispora saccharolytica]
MNIRDIAKKVGVSSATVSRVINQSGYVKDETKQKVLAAIEEAEFVPNAIARSLSIRDSSSIGVIVPDIANEFFSSVISGMGEIAANNQYNIVLFDTGEMQEREHQYLQMAEGQRLSGLIITPVSELDMMTRDKLIQFENKGIPVVLVDRNIRNSSLDGVFVENAAAAYKGVEALIHAGHRKIAIITGPSTSMPGKDRLNGYKAALKDYRMELKEEYIVSGDFKIIKAYERTKELLELADPPTAIFASNNQTSLGVLKYLTEHKLKMGRDISMVGFDQIESLKIIDYRLSTIERDAKKQGYEAMAMLIDKLSHKESKSSGRKIFVPYQVVLRGSELIK